MLWVLKRTVSLMIVSTQKIHLSEMVLLSSRKHMVIKTKRSENNHNILNLDLCIFQEFACNGTVVEHPEYGEVIQLQGDQRNHIKDFLKKVGLAKEEQLKVCDCV